VNKITGFLHIAKAKVTWTLKKDRRTAQIVASTAKKIRQK
jgi:hypothetical protein